MSEWTPVSEGDPYQMYATRAGVIEQAEAQLSRNRRDIDSLRQEYLAVKHEMEEKYSSGPINTEQIERMRQHLRNVEVEGKAIAQQARHDAKYAAESDFPEHQHLWTVVEIDNNPVGVTCQFCDKTMQVAQAAQTLDLNQGTQYEVEGRMYDGTIVKGFTEVSQARYVSNPEHVEVHFQLMRKPQ